MDNLWIIHVYNSCDGSAPNGAEIYSKSNKIIFFFQCVILFQFCSISREATPFRH